MNILIPINGGKSFVYIPQTTSPSTVNQIQEGENQSSNSSEVDPIVGYISISVVTLILIAAIIYCYKVLK